MHFAFKAEDAVSYVSEIVRKKGARSVIKSKSMVSEEIHLNKNLEEMGVKVVESDLGEYIIQLAGETPSHLIAPAIHKTKEQVAELFLRKQEERSQLIRINYYNLLGAIA